MQTKSFQIFKFKVIIVVERYNNVQVLVNTTTFYTILICFIIPTSLLSPKTPYEFQENVRPLIQTFKFWVTYVMPRTSPEITNLITVQVAAFSSNILLSIKDIVFMILKAKFSLLFELSHFMITHSC